MKSLINNVKSEGVFSIIGLVVLGALALSIVVLMAFYSNGNYQASFIIR